MISLPLVALMRMVEEVGEQNKRTPTIIDKMTTVSKPMKSTACPGVRRKQEALVT
jgi:hypothetical protein